MQRTMLDPRTLWRGVLVAALVATPMVVLPACGHRHCHGQNKMDLKQANKRLEILFDYLDATADQRQQIRRQLQTVVREGVGLHGSHQQARRTVLGEWNKAQPDSKVLHALVDRQLKQVNTMGHKLVDALVDVHRVLTPAQRAKLTKLLEARMGH